MSTITRSSTPRQAIRRPDPGTTMPPATCSVTTEKSLSEIIIIIIKVFRTKVVITQNAGLVSLGWQEVSERREIADIIPTYDNTYQQQKRRI
jgi:hypothetical protein